MTSWSEIEREVERRAARRCEYCRMHQSLQGATFHVEHIIPRSRGGSSRLDNLALSCPICSTPLSGWPVVFGNGTWEYIDMLSDDRPSSAPSDPLVITISGYDTYGSVVSVSHTIMVHNVDPTISAVDMSETTIDEGGTISMDIRFFDAYDINVYENDAETYPCCQAEWGNFRSIHR